VSTMRNSLAFVVLAVAIGSAQSVKAQDQAPKLEVYGGYDYVRFQINSDVNGQPPSQTYNANGGGGELTYNLTNWLGVLGDTAGYWATSTSSPARAGAAIPYLFGPRASLRRRTVTPFAQVLAGGVVTSSGIETTGWQNHFAMAAGGGIDIRASRYLSLRPVEAEYFMTKIPDGLNNRQNNFRFSAGLSLLFGRK
jgi:hypothetical protein